MDSKLILQGITKYLMGLILESWVTGPAFPVPDKYVDEIINTELGIVMDKIMSEKDLKNGKVGISILTKDVISRIDITKEAFVMTLTSQINEDWKD